MYKLSRTVPVNEPGKTFLSRHDVWNGLLMKAANALPYVPIMQKCEVIERGEGWLLRDILLNNNPLRERVTFEPETRVIFERVRGDELGRIENVIGEDASGALTLTFSFGLTKQGVPEGSEAENRHFAPMEGAYMGAVASTLAAVRRTVDEQGREKLPLASDADTAGDAGWIYEFFRSADSLDLDRLSAHMTQDVRLTFANYPTSQGIEAFRGAIGQLWSRIKGMSHSLSGAWSLHDGRLGIAEAGVMYTRLDDSLYVCKICTVLRRRGDKVADLRIHGDVTQL
ncbi:MAG TPA: AtaL-like protein [Steroidobacteraceae bacterium]|nr:AtaL-like protein [Steroidobacteraceae bacterium]